MTARKVAAKRPATKRAMAQPVKQPAPPAVTLVTAVQPASIAPLVSSADALREQAHVQEKPVKKTSRKRN